MNILNFIGSNVLGAVANSFFRAGMKIFTAFISDDIAEKLLITGLEELAKSTKNTTVDDEIVSDIKKKLGIK